MKPKPLLIGLMAVAVALAVIVAVFALWWPRDAQNGEDGPEPEWRHLVTFSGTSDAVTDTFEVTGSRFSLNWTAEAENEFGVMFLYVYEPGHILWTDLLTVDWDRAGVKTGTSYVYGSGTYYLDVTVANVSSWSVVIEQLV